MLIFLYLGLNLGLQMTLAQPATSPRELYVRAAAAIAAADSQAAIEPLEQLIVESKNSALTDLAAIHLAECYVQNARYEDAAVLLREWSVRITSDSPALQIDPNLVVHHARVWLQAACKIDSDEVSVESLNALCRRLETLKSDEELATIAVSARQELAKRYVAVNKIEAARSELVGMSKSPVEVEEELLVLQLLQLQRDKKSAAIELKLAELANLKPLTARTGEARLALANSALRQSRVEDAAALLEALDERFEAVRNTPAQLFSSDFEFRYRLLASELALAQDNAERAVDILPATDELLDLNDAQRCAFRFARAEALTRTRQPSRALEDLQWLREQAQAMSQSPAWAATVELRRAELMLTEKKYAELSEIVKEAKAKFPEFPKLHEFDYLLARAALLQIDFEKTRSILIKIVNSNTAVETGRENALARAEWMLGEVDFLEHQYDAAIAAYAKVIQRSTAPWHNLALLQTGKCLELLNRGTEAIAYYERVVSEATDESLRAEASGRLSEIKRTASMNVNTKARR